MKEISLFHEQLKTANLAAGCMRISSLTGREADTFVKTCIDAGITLFDHADLYGGGKSEEVFGAVLKRNPSLRQRIILQTKCGIVPDVCFNFSKEHILASVDNSLKRLGVESVDILLLHRPDTLMEPEEVNEAFLALHQSGKVKHFGVSNQNPGQMRLLQKYCNFPLLVNQLQFSAAHTLMADAGLTVNNRLPQAVNYDGGILEHCREHGIAIQAWSPFQYGFFEGVFLGNEKFKELNETLGNLAKQYGVTPSAIAVAFILRHPAVKQVILGTTKPARIQETLPASELTLTREEWYRIYISAGNPLI